ncbi:hypothetical protein PV326_013446 [Microctonus aethiopoides]|nr:hypothetical protein PV326_013446 [Microctonus aethiopoides]
MRSVDLLVKTLTESETAKESAIDCISDEDGLERRMSGWESEEDADNEEFKPPEGVASQQFDLEEVVSEKRKRYGRSITRGASRSNRGRRSSIVRGKNGHRCKTLGIGADATCRFCEEDKEDSPHLLCDCPTLATMRYHHWGVDFLSKNQLAEKRVTEILRLAPKAKLMVS